MSDTRSPEHSAIDGPAFAVDAAVAAVPGVQRLFSADPAALRALQQVASDGVPRAASALRGDAVSINVAIDDVRPTREVLDDIRAAVQAVGGAGTIEIRVSRIYAGARRGQG